jgi:hypothetical protein
LLWDPGGIAITIAPVPLLAKLPVFPLGLAGFALTEGFGLEGPTLAGAVSVVAARLWLGESR